MKQLFQKHKQRLLYIALGASLMWAFLSILLFFSDYRRLHQGGFLPGPRGWGHPHGRPAAGPAEIDHLQAWVTFSFVNHMFNLSPEYLEAGLAITGSTYPDMTIAEAAKEKGVPADVFLEKVQELLRARIVPPPLTATSTPTP